MRVLLCPRPLADEHQRCVWISTGEDGLLAMLVERAAILLSDRLLRAGSSLQVLEVAGGLRLGTRPEFDPWIRALRQVEKPARLSVAALEILAVVAYRQPVTQAEIAAVRGVDPSASLRTLRDQGVVRITGRKRAVGRPFTYGTTRHFLEIFDPNAPATIQ